MTVNKKSDKKKQRNVIKSRLYTKIEVKTSLKRN